jgi:hypothetical protein
MVSQWSDYLPRLRAHFDSVELIEMICPTRNGDPIECYRVYELKGYHGGVPFKRAAWCQFPLSHGGRDMPQPSSF